MPVVGVLVDKNAGELVVGLLLSRVGIAPQERILRADLNEELVQQVGPGLDGAV